MSDKSTPGSAATDDDGGMTTLTLSDTTVERIILALQVMATERTEPDAERAAYVAALNEVGEACRG